MRRVGIIGCGTIGTALARAIERDHATVAKVVALVDQTREHALQLQRQLASHPPIVSVPELIRRSHLVLEAATGPAAAEVVRLALAAHRDVMVMSTGGLLALGKRLDRFLQRSRGQVYLPSGALSGLDGLKAMARGRIRRIRLTTSKPPAALALAPFVRANHLHLDRLTRPTVIFSGSPAAVATAFPQNTNVAATMALAARLNGRASRASIPMTVRVVADPTIRRNRHELEIDGDCGRIRCEVESRPSSTNPKTSELAVRSALVTLGQLFGQLHIGT